MIRTSLLVAGALTVFACGGSTSAESEAARNTNPDVDASRTPSEARGAEASTDSSAPEQVLRAVDDAITRLSIDEALLGRVPGCDAKYRPVAYERTTRKMVWTGCASADAKPPQGAADYPTISRELSTEEASEVEQALRSVEYEEKPACGGNDGLEYFMSTWTAAGIETKYSAQNINCTGYRRAPKIGEVYALLEKLRG